MIPHTKSHKVCASSGYPTTDSLSPDGRTGNFAENFSSPRTNHHHEHFRTVKSVRATQGTCIGIEPRVVSDWSAVSSSFAFNELSLLVPPVLGDALATSDTSTPYCHWPAFCLPRLDGIFILTWPWPDIYPAPVFLSGSDSSCPFGDARDHG